MSPVTDASDEFQERVESTESNMPDDLELSLSSASDPSNEARGGGERDDEDDHGREVFCIDVRATIDGAPTTVFAEKVYLGQQRL